MQKKHAWIVTVDMGYGHQRAAYPLHHLSPNGKVVIANKYEGIPKKDRRIWLNSRKSYEWISRLTSLPLIGRPLFELYDRLQEIPSFYPHRDLSKPNIQLKTMYRWMRKKNWGKNLVEYLNQKDMPMITSFFVTAFFAEEHGFKNDIYCVVCDADISRAWVPLDPKKSRIKYFAPCRRVVERLQLYGVKKENIFLTGFPLPKENLGGHNLTILKKDLADRLVRLDPCHHYRRKYGSTVQQFLKKIDLRRATTGRSCANRIPTLTFAVGGAGAQRRLASQILFSLKNKILKKQINLNLVAGSRNDVLLYFKDQIRKAKLNKRLNKNLNIVFDVEKIEYFKKFNKVLRTTDILWTKPSELVFYAALGLPIIMAPTVGSQEDFNHDWLKTIGAGIEQKDPKYTHEWLFDMVNSGWLAEAAMSGFLDERQFGVYSIEDVVFKGVKEPMKHYQLL